MQRETRLEWYIIYPNSSYSSYAFLVDVKLRTDYFFRGKLIFVQFLIF